MKANIGISDGPYRGFGSLDKWGTFLDLQEELTMVRFSLVFSLAVATLAVGPASRVAHAGPAGKCPAPEFRQFDFWLGDWDTFEVVGDTTKSIARTHVDLIAAGCAVHELYEQTDGLIGDSILSFDPVRKAWQQTWVTNGGSLMVLTGPFKDGVVNLEGEYHSGTGKTFRTRITWKVEGGGVRESSTMSKDGGKTWEPNFDVLFKKHK